MRIKFGKEWLLRFQERHLPPKERFPILKEPLLKGKESLLKLQE